MVKGIHRTSRLPGFELTTLVVIGTAINPTPIYDHNGPFFYIECMKLEQNRKQKVGKYKISEKLIIIECLQITDFGHKYIL
jgi:hypothetical protein